MSYRESDDSIHRSEAEAHRAEVRAEARAYVLTIVDRVVCVAGMSVGTVAALMCAISWGIYAREALRGAASVTPPSGTTQVAPYPTVGIGESYLSVATGVVAWDEATRRFWRPRAPDGAWVPIEAVVLYPTDAYVIACRRIVERSESFDEPAVSWQVPAPDVQVTGVGGSINRYGDDMTCVVDRKER